MKKKLITSIMITLAVCAFAQWKPAGDRIKTKWAEQINPDSVLPEYPRPQMERGQWANLNGLWKYAIRGENSTRPDKFDGDILVPFAVESSLSGVMKTLKPSHSLWYERSFKIPADWKGKNVLLHFGAVDWKADVFVNSSYVGSHTGGYTPFSFDITNFISDGDNVLTVKVWDPTDSRMRNPCGKQTLKPAGCFYTAVSGIWQTVWLEPVAKTHISSLKITPNLDESRFEIEAPVAGSADFFAVRIFDGKKLVAESKGAANGKAFVQVADPKLWSPDSPFIYDVEVDLFKDGALVDSVKSYAAMRKISITNMSYNSSKWITLNNKKIYMFGPLDQGWWPDGLYTAPTDEALKFDVQKTKDWGYNMIRKHIKIEPARWYMHCDRIGLLVWQDIPSAQNYTARWNDNNFAAQDAPIVKSEAKNNSRFKITTPRDVENFRKEMTEMVDCLYSFPCIAIWVPFNEAWGQFDTVNIVNYLKTLDPTRPINAASGGNFFQCGDIIDFHHYPEPRIRLYSDAYVNVLGEYGGIGIATEGHHWTTDKNWGYGKLLSNADALKRYGEYAKKLEELAKLGIVSAVYTQTTDVEVEINGIMTYDRKVIKFDEAQFSKINRDVIRNASD